jgi:branched-chain amino acid transport system permease protein
VADDHEAALSIGIPLNTIWIVVWSAAGLVAIVGGLIIGVGEKLAEVYWGPLVGGAIENWFAYVLALAFLLVRPQGLFGERIIERV